MKDSAAQRDDAYVMLLPDPADRTNNDPIYLMSSGDVLKLVNKFIEKANHFALLGTGAEYLSAKREITKEHLETILSSALRAGWSEAFAIGKQIMFVKKEYLPGDLDRFRATSLPVKASPVEITK